LHEKLGKQASGPLALALALDQDQVLVR
jgi:hypothetical protein